MIALATELSEVTKPSAEWIKIRCLYDSYRDGDVLFWSQDGGKAYLSLADGNLNLYRNGGDLSELREFIAFLSPDTVFGDLATLKALGLSDAEAVNVVSRKADIAGDTAGDVLSSKEVYELLHLPQFTLPDYPAFAVDYCRRLNRGYADCFGIKGKCAAVSFHTGGYALLNGIVSREKGCGTAALRAILQKNKGRELVACCADELLGFYRKNKFEMLYQAGYWWKT